MAELKLPFKEMFRDALLDGRKTATTRTKKYGHMGDTFRAFGGRFELSVISCVELSAVVEYEYKAEGFPDAVEFIEMWDSLHPHLKYGCYPSQPVYFHLFRRLPDG